MKYDYPDHFSYNFELPLDKLPTKKSDRISPRVLYPGLLLGLILIVLGSYELLNGMGHEKTVFDELSGNRSGTDYEPFINLAFFDVSIILIGLGIIIALIFSYLRYKKIYFDGKYITVVYRPSWGKKISYKEALNKYSGIRFRIEFYQRGFINGNRYIVELYHKDPKKIVPLYISTNENNIRRIWEYYSRTLGLPALTLTDEGIVVRQVEDLDKSLKEMAKTWKLKEKFDPTAPRPASIAVVRKSDKTVIKSRKIIWDAYNLIALAVIVICAGVLSYEYFSNPNLNKLFGDEVVDTVYTVCTILLVAAFIVLFRKDKLVLKKYKIVNVHKIMSYSRKKDEIAKADIEAVDVVVNPATERRYLAIISDEKTIIFGKKLPAEDLRWIKNFLIYEIVK